MTSLLGRWTVTEIPDFNLKPASIAFGEKEGSFVFASLVGAFASMETDALSFDWTGHDEMDPARGSGWAQITRDGSLEGEITTGNGDEIAFKARRAATSSTAC